MDYGFNRKVIGLKLNNIEKGYNENYETVFVKG